MKVNEIINEALPGAEEKKSWFNWGKGKEQSSSDSKMAEKLQRGVDAQFKVWLNFVKKNPQEVNTPPKYYNKFMRQVLNSPGINSKSFMNKSSAKALNKSLQSKIGNNNISADELKEYMKKFYMLAFNMPIDATPAQSRPAPQAAPQAQAAPAPEQPAAPKPAAHKPAPNAPSRDDIKAAKMKDNPTYQKAAALVDKGFEPFTLKTAGGSKQMYFRDPTTKLWTDENGRPIGGNRNNDKQQNMINRAYQRQKANA